MENNLEKPPIVLTIAGSDSSGGAGIQADLKTFEYHGVFGTTAITALTAQNTTGVTDIEPVSPKLVFEQIRMVYEDLGVHATKIGMLFSDAIIKSVVKAVDMFSIQPIVLDPVMVASSGARLLEESAIHEIRMELLPRATLITPNFKELETLSGLTCQTEQQIHTALETLYESTNTSILATGGDGGGNEATDYFFDGSNIQRITAPRVSTNNTHGTGCTYSSAIAANLALGSSLIEAIHRSKQYVYQAILSAPSLGKGYGPLNHRVGKYI